MAKKQKKYSYKKKSNNKIKLLVGGLLVVLAFFLYKGVSTGTGIFGAFSTPASVNRIVVEDENQAGSAAELKAIRNLNTAANQEARAKTPEQKKKAEDAVNKAAQDVAAAQQAVIAKKAEDAKTDKCASACSNPTSSACISCKAAQQPNQPPVVNPVTTGGGAPPKVCNTGNAGINVEAGKWVATGYGLDKDGNRCTANGCSQRECVQITDSCGHSKPKPCDLQYKTDPNSVVLPPSAGPEYTAGQTPAEIAKAKADAIAKGEVPPKEPIAKNQCYDKNASGMWVIVTDGTKKSGDANQTCADGKFVPNATYTAQKKAECEADKLHVMSADGKCNPITLTPTEKEKKAKADQCRAENKEYNSAKNECGSTMKCGVGYTLRGGYCDVSEVTRVQVIKAGEEFCAKLQGKKFDPGNGLCIPSGAALYQGPPLECTPGVTYISGTKNGYKFCDLDKSGKVTGIRTIFCDTSIATYDSKTGTCTLNTGVVTTKIVNQTGKVGGTASKPTDCKYEGAYLQIGGLYVCPGEPKPVVPVEVPKPATTPDAPKIVNQTGKVGGTASKPTDCKYEGAYLQIGGLYVCPGEPKPVTTVEPPKAVISSNSYQTLKVGDNCGSFGYPSCDKCPNASATKYTEANLGTSTPNTFNKCGNVEEVKKLLDADKIPPTEQKIVGDNSAEKTLKVGDVCKDSVLSSTQCSQCPGASAEITVDGKKTKICGSAEEVEKLNLVNTSGNLKTPNTVGANAAIGGGAGCVAGATTGAIIGATAGLGVFSGATALVGGAAGCIVGAIGGAGIGAAVTPVDTTPTNVSTLKRAGESCGHKVAGFILVKDSNGDASCNDGACEFMPGIAENGVDVRSSGYYCK